MTTNHIDQLTQWWENAEQGAPKPGDTIIIHLGDDGYRIDTASTSWVYWERYGDTRILARAPKPKPAWHDAVAVIAHTEEGHIRQAWERDSDTGYWLGTEGCLAHADALRDVTPLIEAKVTDEMVQRARHRADSLAAAFIYSASEWHMREVLTAALGLETK